MARSSILLPRRGFASASACSDWDEVNWQGEQIVKGGKGCQLTTLPITDRIRAVLEPLRGHHEEFVFTYVAQRERDGREVGKRYPLTYSGVKIAWRRLRTKAGVKDFRFHDFRHNLATKMLRSSGNIKIVQRALNHKDMRTTSKYAHVLDDEVTSAFEEVQAKIIRS